MNRMTLACGLVFMTATTLFAQGRPAPSRAQAAGHNGSAPIELVFLRDRGPLLVRLHVMLEGQPVHAHWQQYLERWFDFLDKKKRGTLDEAALAGAPKAAFMRNLALQGGFFPNRGTSLTLSDFGKRADESVSRSEFIDYYRKSGINPIQLSVSPQEVTAQANTALFKKLDANSDGKLSRTEIDAGRELFAQLDVDDDELLAVREFAPNAAQPFGRGAFMQQPGPGLVQPLQGTSFFHITSENARTGLATLLLARYDKNKRLSINRTEMGLDEVTFARLDENKNGSLDLVELANFPKNAAPIEIVVNLRAANLTPPLKVLKSADLPPQALRSSPGMVSVALGDAEVSVQNLDVGPTRAGFNQFNFVLQQLKAADTKMRGYVELSDLQGQQFQFLRTMFPILDRDDDGKVMESETQAYLNLQDKGRQVSTSFFVQEQGRNWFQNLDANRDGQLSPRELLTAWSRLAVHDKNSDGVIDAGELPMQFRVVFNPAGNQQFIVDASASMGRTAPVRDNLYPAHAPIWFRKMDRNRDGDVSRREFLGARDDFDRIDRDANGLIDADEAAGVAKR